MNTSYLLINTEFRDQTYLFGFELFAQINGSINLKVKYLIIKKRKNILNINTNFK